MIVDFAPEYKRAIKALVKRYRHIKDDLDPLQKELEHGKTPGDQITGIGLEIFKVRVVNSDNKKGKSGGYRVIYLKSEARIVLLTIYSKSDQGDIEAAGIAAIVKRLPQPPGETPD